MNQLVDTTFKLLSSCQRRHLHRGARGVQSIPVFQKLLLMQRCPFQDHRRRPSWQITLNHRNRLQGDERRPFTVLRVQMRWRGSSKNMRITMPKKRLISGTWTPQTQRNHIGD